jgi:hypothetical protein
MVGVGAGAGAGVEVGVLAGEMGPLECECWGRIDAKEAFGAAVENDVALSPQPARYRLGIVRKDVYCVLLVIFTTLYAFTR